MSGFVGHGNDVAGPVMTNRYGNPAPTRYRLDADDRCRATRITSHANHQPDPRTTRGALT